MMITDVTTWRLLDVYEVAHNCYLRRHTLASLCERLEVAQERTVQGWIQLAEDLGVAFRVLRDERTHQRSWAITDHAEIEKLDSILDARAAASGRQKG